MDELGSLSDSEVENDVNDSAMDDEGDADDEEEEEQHTARAGVGVGSGGAPPKKKRQKKTHKKLPGFRTSHSSEKSKNPERARAERASELALRIHQFLELRGDIKAEVVNRVILRMSAEDRATLRALHAMEQEWYLSSRDVAQRCRALRAAHAAHD